MQNFYLLHQKFLFLIIQKMDKKLLIVWLVIASSLTLAGCGTPTQETPTPEQPVDQPTTPEQPIDEPTMPEQPIDETTIPEQPIDETNGAETELTGWDTSTVENTWSTNVEIINMETEETSNTGTTTEDTTITINE